MYPVYQKATGRIKEERKHDASADFHQVLGDFQRENPNMLLRVYSGAGEKLAVHSTGEDYDLILTPQLLPMERRHVKTKTIYEGNYVMLISREHPGFRDWSSKRGSGSRNRQ